MVGRSLLVACLFLTATPARADDGVGRVVALTGEAKVKRGDSPLTPLKRGDYIQEGDTIETGPTSSLRLLMRDKSVLALPARTGLRIASYAVRPENKERQVRLKVLAGRLWASVSEALSLGSKYEVESGNAVAGVRGTELVVDATAGGDAVVTVITGEVKLASGAGEQTLGEHDRGKVESPGTIAVDATSDAGVAELRETVRPPPDLDPATTERRLEALRKKGDGEAAAEPDVASNKSEHTGREEPGTGDSTFDNAASAADDGGGTREGPADVGGPGPPDFDPTTMARVHVSVQVRP